MGLLSSKPLVKFELRVHYSSLHHFDRHSVQRPSSLVALKLMDSSRYRLVQWRRRDPRRHGSQISFVSAVMDPNATLSPSLSCYIAPPDLWAARRIKRLLQQSIVHCCAQSCAVNRCTKRVNLMGSFISREGKDERGFHQTHVQQRGNRGFVQFEMEWILH
jgi:hypothetical protein